jgi:hypothetical protein
MCTGQGGLHRGKETLRNTGRRFARSGFDCRESASQSRFDVVLQFIVRFVGAGIFGAKLVGILEIQSSASADHMAKFPCRSDEQRFAFLASDRLCVCQMARRPDDSSAGESHANVPRFDCPL